MKFIVIIFTFLLMNAASFASIFSTPKLDTVNVEIQSDEGCPGSIINFHIINKSITPLDSIFWRGDWDVNNQMYYFWRNGSALDNFTLNPMWIFSTNNGLGKFPVSVTIKNVLGFTKTYCDTVETGEPFVEILNDPLTCCSFNDTVKVAVRYLTKPYNTCMWYDNATGMAFPIIEDEFPMVLLTGRSSIELRVRIEDSKGCKGEVIKFFNLTTGISNVGKSSILLSPNPTSNKATITGLLENETNDLFIFDLLGKQVYTQKVQGAAAVDLSALSKGVYLVRIGDFVKRVVKL